MEIDNLQISITADANKAVLQLKKLEKQLISLSNATSGANFSSLDRLSTSLTTLNSALRIDSRLYSTFARNIKKLDSIKVGNVSSLTSQIQILANTLNSAFSGSSNAVLSITELTKSIARLGYKSTTQGINNIPVLANNMLYLTQVLSKAPMVSRNLIDMTNALANLSRQGNRVGRTANTMSSGINLVGNTARRHTKSFGSLTSAIGRFYAKWFLIIRGVKALWSGIEGAFDYTEAYNYFNVVTNKMGSEMAQKMGEYGEESAKSYTESFTNSLNNLTTQMTGYTIGSMGETINSGSVGLGMNVEQIVSYQAKISAVTNAVGLMGSVSTDTAKALTMLSEDLSSLTNTDLDTVMDNLASGLVGQSKAVYKYGADITSASLSNYALALGIQKSVSEMTQSEKMQLRVIALLDQLKVAYGDAGNTINSVANQYRVFKQQITQLGRVLGELFLPIVKYVLPYVNGLTIALTQLFETLGFKIWGSGWLTDLQDGISSGVVDTSDLLEELDSTTESAKELKNELMGFDEINKLSDVTDNASVLGDSLDLSAEISKSLAEYEKIWNQAINNSENLAGKIAIAIREGLKPLEDIFDSLFEGDFEGAGSKLGKLVTSLNNTIANAISQVDWQSVGNSIGEFIGGIDWKSVVTSMGNVLQSLVDAILDVWSGSFDANPLATVIMTALIGVNWAGLGGLAGLGALGGTLGGGVSTLSSATLSIKSATITAAVGYMTGSWLYNNVGSVKESADSIWEMIFSIKDGEYSAKEWVDAIYKTLTKHNPDSSKSNGSKLTGTDYRFGLGDTVKNILLGLTTTEGSSGRSFAGVSGKFGIANNEDVKKSTDTIKKYKESFFVLGNSIKDADNKLSAFSTNSKTNTSKISDAIKSATTSEFKIDTTSVMEKIGNIGSKLKEALTASAEVDNIGVSNSAIIGATAMISNGITEDTETIYPSVKKVGVVAESVANAGNKIIEGLESVISRVAIGVVNAGSNLVGSASVGASSVIAGLTLNRFANGGILEDGLFTMSKGEIVGSFSDGTSFVANQNQQVEAIENAAYRGFMRAMASGSMTTNVTLSANSRNLFKVVQNEANAYSRQTNRPAFS